jgi:hypothetical protein
MNKIIKKYHLVSSLREKLNSRKLMLILWAFLIILSSYTYVVDIDPTNNHIKLFDSLTWSIIALVGIYSGFNVGAKWVSKPSEKTEVETINSCSSCGHELGGK